MLKVIYIIQLLIVTCILDSCIKVEEDISGYWVVEEAYINKKPFIWEFMDNSIILNSDSTCQIPFKEDDFFNNEFRTGKWKFYEVDGKMFLQIISKNDFFGRKFQIRNLRNENEVSYGYYKKMTLVDDSLEILCVKAVSK
jgi:hypothetical protein